MGFLSGLFKDENEKMLKRYEARVPLINSFEENLQKLSDAELRSKTEEFKNRLQSGSTLDDILPEAFAVVREASKRVSEKRHFDVQLIGGMILNDGNLAEMRTGEGKTLMATLPSYLNALSGKGVHVVTVNDYLSQRDAVWMGQIHDFLGLSVGVIAQAGSFIYDSAHQNLDEERDEEGSFKIVHEFLRPVTRKEAYAADITYGTNSEFGFDYLRDNIEYNENSLRQRGHNFAIIDEIDSILIDEARTPLIISAPAADSQDLYGIFSQIAEQLKEDEDFTVDEKLKAVSINDSGIDKAEKALGVENIYTEKGVKYVHHLETAVRAKSLFKKDKQYVVKDNEIVIVDEFTGRMQPGRRWSEGLHQAIEAKEGVKIQQESRTYASITYQNYFRMYEKLSGMSGTAKTNGEEFLKVYNLDVVTVPPNSPTIRLDRDDLIFQTQIGKFKAIAKKVKEIHSTGQPVLIGTVSIETNELLSTFLASEGIPHQVLNAKNHEQEGQIIAQAGRKGSVTIATNMAGRGVDIILGGAPYEEDAYKEIKSLGGLFVVGTERHDARRIDNQLRGRSGRQGDPGETQFFVSLDDSLMRIFASSGVKTLMSKLGLPEDQPIENKIITKSLESAQTKIEGFNFDSRKHILEFDNVLNTQRKSIYERRRKLLLGDVPYIESELKRLASLDEKVSKIVEEKKAILNEEELIAALRRLMLQSIDNFWIDHLELMSYLRSSVGLRAYGQRDPLIEYKKEGLRVFNEMLAGIDENIINLLPHIGAGAFQKEEEKLKETMKKAQMISNQDQTSENNQSTSPKFGRNDIVKIEKDGEEKEVKWKKAEEMLNDGWTLKS
ncbi:MAG: preprotein translocase subunit SecA [Candidatus Paceibacterota bacterium]